MSDVIIRPIDISRDCQALADLFNESDPAWPGGLTHGLPLTAESAHDWIEAERTLVTYVAVDGDRIVGFSSFLENTPWPSGQYGSGYLDLLNVHPDYHGNSIGRKLIQATIERSVQEGWVYQTLGTWSANFKAVPAYKKTGHFWRPDTSVWMQNFIPGALQMPLARSFFDRHDWYATYVRPVEQHSDDERWEGMKVYRQHWEAEGESLTIWIDREAQAPCAIETDEVFVAAIPREIEPPQGATVQMNWRIQNKRADAIHVHLHALGSDGLTIDHRDAFTVPAGLSVDHVASVKVSAETPHRKLDGSAPAVRSLIMLDHVEVDLFSGLRALKPLSVDTDPDPLSLAPGRETTIALQFHSELDRAVSAVCYLIPSEGLVLDWTENAVALDAKGHASLSLSLKATCAGIHTVQVRLAPRDGAAEVVKEELTLFAVPAGGLLSQQSGEEIRLETDAVRASVSARFGSVKLTHKDADVTLMGAHPLVGPPYFPSDFDKKHFHLRLEQADGFATVHMQAEPEHHTDSRLEVTVRLAATGLLAIEEQLVVLGAEPYSGRLAFDVSWQGSDKQVFTFPLQLGAVREAAANYPVNSEDVPNKVEEYAEPWLATEWDGIAAGVAWSAGTAQVRPDPYQVRLLSAPLDVARGERSEAIRYALWTGRGDWHAAREALLHWAGRPARSAEVSEPEARGVVRAATERPVYGTLSDLLEATLVVDSVATRRMSGVVTIAPEGGLTVERAKADINELWREHPVAVPLKMRVPAVPGRYGAQVHLDLPSMVATSAFDVLRLGGEGPVSVTSEMRDGQPVWVVGNGSATFAVAPDYGQAVISWRHDGLEQLQCPFPTPASYAWAHPWFGGIQPRLYLNNDAEDCGNLVGERFEAQEIDVDAQGLPWRGVRLSTRPERKELHDLGFEVDYVTLPHSPLLKLVLRVTNLRSTRQNAYVGGGASFTLGGPHESLTLHGEDVVRRPTPYDAWQSAQTWAALVQAETGTSVLSVCPQRKLVLSDHGQQGRGVGLSGKLKLAGNATREVVWYCWLAEDLDRALAMKGLAAL